jgi:hypothetical protein
MGRPITAPALVLDKAAAGAAVRLEFRAGRIDFDARPVIVELQGEEASRVGRERDRGAAHQFSQNPGRLLGVACGDRKMVDHVIPHEVRAEA